MTKSLILGGARSGKSGYAESLAQQYQSVSYVATAIIFDEEIRNRVNLHQQDRPDHWRTIEEPVDLATAIKQAEQYSECILIDCLTFWVNNCLYDSNHIWSEQKQAFLDLLDTVNSPVIMVSNETSMGITPMGKESRQFIDEAGWLHQQVAKRADSVILMVAGLPCVLKSAN